MELRIKRMRPDAVLPRYATEGASGMDLHACIERPRRIEEGERARIPTGIAVSVPEGYEAQVRPRSGLASKGVEAVLGTIDRDYTGEVQVVLAVHSGGSFTVRPGDRIAQLVIAPVVRAELVEVDELEETVRGAGGFGSTGVREKPMPVVEHHARRFELCQHDNLRSRCEVCTAPALLFDNGEG